MTIIMDQIITPILAHLGFGVLSNLFLGQFPSLGIAGHEDLLPLADELVEVYAPDIAGAMKFHHLAIAYIHASMFENR